MSISAARERLQIAISDLEEAHRVWSEAVTAQHMAEIRLKQAQKHTRQAFDVLQETLTHQ